MLEKFRHVEGKHQSRPWKAFSEFLNFQLTFNKKIINFVEFEYTVHLIHSKQVPLLHNTNDFMQ